MPPQRPNLLFVAMRAFFLLYIAVYAVTSITIANTFKTFSASDLVLCERNDIHTRGVAYTVVNKDTAMAARSSRLERAEMIAGKFETLSGGTMRLGYELHAFTDVKIQDSLRSSVETVLDRADDLLHWTGAIRNSFAHLKINVDGVRDLSRLEFQDVVRGQNIILFSPRALWHERQKASARFIALRSLYCITTSLDKALNDIVWRLEELEYGLQEMRQDAVEFIAQGTWITLQLGIRSLNRAFMGLATDFATSAEASQWIDVTVKEQNTSAVNAENIAARAPLPSASMPNREAEAPIARGADQGTERHSVRPSEAIQHTSGFYLISDTEAEYIWTRQVEFAAEANENNNMDTALDGVEGMSGILAYDPDQEGPKQIQDSEVYREQASYLAVPSQGSLGTNTADLPDSNISLPLFHSALPGRARSPMPTHAAQPSRHCAENLGHAPVATENPWSGSEWSDPAGVTQPSVRFVEGAANLSDEYSVPDATENAQSGSRSSLLQPEVSMPTKDVRLFPRITQTTAVPAPIEVGMSPMGSNGSTTDASHANRAADVNEGLSSIHAPRGPGAPLPTSRPSAVQAPSTPRHESGAASGDSVTVALKPFPMSTAARLSETPASQSDSPLPPARPASEAIGLRQPGGTLIERYNLEEERGQRIYHPYSMADRVQKGKQSSHMNRQQMHDIGSVSASGPSTHERVQPRRHATLLVSSAKARPPTMTAASATPVEGDSLPQAMDLDLLSQPQLHSAVSTERKPALPEQLQASAASSLVQHVPALIHDFGKQNPVTEDLFAHTQGDVTFSGGSDVVLRGQPPRPLSPEARVTPGRRELDLRERLHGPSSLARTSLPQTTMPSNRASSDHVPMQEAVNATDLIDTPKQPERAVSAVSYTEDTPDPTSGQITPPRRARDEEEGAPQAASQWHRVGLNTLPSVIQHAVDVFDAESHAERRASSNPVDD
ncbi:hypothetical protein DENSPDRAFT_886685 [Dentipellis sp. KUC8613]|nr:hypothetical protein DENSPDRAFT_886685 [Dentipellis sp. KUC8613]